MSVQPHGGSVFFILMMLTIAGNMGFFFFNSSDSLISRSGEKNPVLRARNSGVLWILIILILIFFPLDPVRISIYRIHILLGTLLFLSGALVYGFYGILFLKIERLLKAPGYIGLVTAVLSAIFSLLLFLTEFVGVLPQHVLTYLIEWTFFSAAILWSVFTGAAFLRMSAGGAEPGTPGRRSV